MPRLAAPPRSIQWWRCGTSELTSRGCSVGRERLEAGILDDHQAHLIAQLLPFADEIAGVLFCHYFGALFFQNPDHGDSVRTPSFRLGGSSRLQSTGHAVKFGVNG